MNKLIKFINEVRFMEQSPSSKTGWRTISPSQLDNSHLVHKTRYHMKQMLACLLELKKREQKVYRDNKKSLDASVCTILSQKLTEYKACEVKLTENGLKLLVKLERNDV